MPSLNAKSSCQAWHIVDTGYVDAQLLVESQRDYQIDLVGPTRRCQGRWNHEPIWNWPPW